MDGLSGWSYARVILDHHHATHSSTSKRSCVGQGRRQSLWRSLVDMGRISLYRHVYGGVCFRTGCMVLPRTYRYVSNSVILRYVRALRASSSVLAAQMTLLAPSFTWSALLPSSMITLPTLRPVPSSARTQSFVFLVLAALVHASYHPQTSQLLFCPRVGGHFGRVSMGTVLLCRCRGAGNAYYTIIRITSPRSYPDSESTHTCLLPSAQLHVSTSFVRSAGTGCGFMSASDLIGVEFGIRTHIQ